MKILDIPRSGSYQGLTSSRNRYGQYVRSRATPVNPGTSFQMAVRARLQLVASDWRNLTSLQREGWGTLGQYFTRQDSLGQVYSLTGFQAYASVNANLLAAGDAQLSDAPAFATPDPMATITPTITASTASVAYTATPLAAGQRVFIYASQLRSPGRTFENDMRLLAVSAAAAASPADVFSAWSARFGTPIVGQRVFFAVARYAGGFLSQPLLSSVLVT